MSKLLVDLGSGRQAMEVQNYIHVDIADLTHIEYVHDLNNGLPKNSVGDPIFCDVDEFRAHHIFEHIDVRNFIPLLNEIWDALKSGGILKVYVPNATHVEAAWSDPTHVRAFTPKTFWYFTKEGNSAYPYTDKTWHYIKEPTVNGTEGDWWEIECWLSPDKQ